jgi:hypothetical protein
MYKLALVAALSLTATSATAFEIVSLRNTDGDFWTADVDVKPSESVDYVVCRLLDANNNITGSQTWPVTKGYNQVLMVADLPGTKSISCSGKRYGG